METKVFSILISALTTGMSSASISCACNTLPLVQRQIPSDSSSLSLFALADDFDSDPDGRKNLPSFYGYLPDEGTKRTIMYACMVLNSALLLLLRSVGAALLMLADTKIFVAYMAGDQLLYLLQKLVRGDFLHWIPLDGMSGLACSFLERVMVKTLTDFTGVLQFRGAGEMGGAAWLWAMSLALVAPWVAVPVYFGSLTSNPTNVTAIETVLNNTDSNADAGDLQQPDKWELKQSDIWELLSYMTVLWLTAFAVFLGLMKKEYRKTFWSLETGNEWIQSYFIRGREDETKQKVFHYNKRKWKAIEPQVKEWVGRGWMRWERDKPDWFTDHWKASVPVPWVPTEGKADHKRAKESERRMSFGGGERKRSIIYAAA
jgi:hypothetical protein